MSKARDDARRNARRRFALHHGDGSPVGEHSCIECADPATRALAVKAFASSSPRM